MNTTNVSEHFEMFVIAKNQRKIKSSTELSHTVTKYHPWLRNRTYEDLVTTVNFQTPVHNRARHRVHIRERRSQLFSKSPATKKEKELKTFIMA